MLDWKEHVRGKLAGLGLSGEREEDLTQELAQQMEDAYRQARLEGSSEKEALRRAKSEVDDWESLIREVRSLDRPLIRAVPSRWI